MSIATEIREPAAPAADGPEPTGARHRAVASSTPWGAFVTLFSVALALRVYRIKDAYNIFIDEVTYSQIDRNVGTGHGLTLYGAPFNLHPPVAFEIFGAITRISGVANQPPDQTILALRTVAAVFGALTVVVTVLIVRSCRLGTAPTVAVAALLAIDPFQISYDSRVMLEAPAQFFLVCCIAAVLHLIRREDTGRGVRTAMIVTAGASAGLVAGTKETFGLVIAVALLLMLVVPGILRRRTVLAIIGVALAVTVAINAAVWLTTGFDAWWHAHTSGLARLVGTEQTTGFNARSTKVSLSSRVAANLHQFAVTYAILLTGGVCTLVQLWRLRPWRPHLSDAVARARAAVALWNLAACGYLVYATLFGSIEEQMYYITLVPCLLSLALTVSGRGRRRRLRRLAAVVCVCALAFQATVWASVHRTDNDSYEAFFSWERTHVVEGTRIGVAEDAAQFILENVTIGQWTTLAQLRSNNADYVLVDEDLVDQGYSAMTPATLAYLRAHATVAFRADSGGDVLYLFDLRGAY